MPWLRLSELGAVVRWREWYDSKLLLFVVAMTWAVLRAPAAGPPQIARMAELFALLCLYASFGHIANDYADREADRAAGKRKVLSTWSDKAARLAVAISGFATAGLGWLVFDGSTFLLTLLTLALAALYSLPPVCLKQRGLVGWGTAALAQRTLPVAIVFQAFHAWDLAAVAFLVLNTLIGLRFIIIHQLADRANDLGAGVHTVATEQNPHTIIKLLRAVFMLEVISLCATVAAMAYAEPALCVVVLGYAGAVAIDTWRGRPIVPGSYAAFSGFYHVLWPITLVVLLAIRAPLFLPLVLVTAALAQHQVRLKLRAIVRVQGAAAEQLRLKP